MVALTEEGGYLVVPQSVLEIFGTGLSFLFSKQYFTLLLPFLPVLFLEWQLGLIHSAIGLALGRERIDKYLILSMIIFILILIFYGLAIGIDAQIIADELLGRETGLKKSINATLRVFKPLIGSLILATLIVIFPFLAFILVGFIMNITGIGVWRFTTVMIGYLFSIALSVFFVSWLCLMPVVVVLEERRPLDALRRSIELIRGDWLHVFAIVLIISIGNCIMSFIAAYIENIVSIALTETPLSQLCFFIEPIISNLIDPISVGMLTALYFDLLARKPYLKNF